MAENNTLRAVPGGKPLETLAGEVSRQVARMRYLAMAADCIANGSAPAGPDRENCVGYLMDTLQYLGALATDEAESLERIAAGEPQ